MRIVGGRFRESQLKLCEGIRDHRLAVELFFCFDIAKLSALYSQPICDMGSIAAHSQK